MKKYKIEVYVVGSVQTNCYFLINSDTKEAIIFDPGDRGEILEQKLKGDGYTAKAIFITHGHFDHILAAPYLQEKLSIPVIAGTKEKKAFCDPQINMASNFAGGDPLKPDEFYNDGDIIEYAGFKVKVIHTPGHTSGSVCYYLEEEKILFSGDTLFNYSVGRTDFPTGSLKEILNSVNNKLMKLPDDVEVFPGHGEDTTIGFERDNNPYVR